MYLFHVKTALSQFVFFGGWDLISHLLTNNKSFVNATKQLDTMIALNSLKI